MGREASRLSPEETTDDTADRGGGEGEEEEDEENEDEDADDDESVGGPGEAADMRGSTEGMGEGEGDTVGERIGSGDCAVAFESGEGHGRGDAPEEGAARGMVGRSGGGGVATVNTGGQGGGDEGCVGIKRGGSCPEEREGVWQAGDGGETSGGHSTVGADKLVSGPRSGSAWGSRDLQGLGLLVTSAVFSMGTPMPLYSLRRTFCSMQVVGFFFLTALQAGCATLVSLNSLPSESAQGFLCTLRSNTDSHWTGGLPVPSAFCLTPLDKSSGCWLHTGLKVELAAHSLDTLNSSKHGGLTVSLSSLPDKLHTGEELL